MKQKSVIGIPGFVYRIPLFLTDVSPLQRFSKKDFDSDENRYSYCRVIADKAGSGILIEVFKYVGVDATKEAIVGSGRLFDPVVIVGDGIKRKRWQKVFEFDEFDEEKDAARSEIERKISGILSSGRGVRMWTSLQIERKIVESLPSQLKEEFDIVLKDISDM